MQAAILAALILGLLVLGIILVVRYRKGSRRPPLVPDIVPALSGPQPGPVYEPQTPVAIDFAIPRPAIDMPGAPYPDMYLQPQQEQTEPWRQQIAAQSRQILPSINPTPYRNPKNPQSGPSSGRYQVMGQAGGQQISGPSAVANPSGGPTYPNSALRDPSAPSGPSGEPSSAFPSGRGHTYDGTATDGTVISNYDNTATAGDQQNVLNLNNEPQTVDQGFSYHPKPYSGPYTTGATASANATQ